MPSDPQAEPLQAHFLEFLERRPAGCSLYVLGHSDTDGLSAAAILTRSLREAGIDSTADVTRKGENAWSASVAERAGRSGAGAAIVADLGSRSDPLFERMPVLLIDHHKHTGVPPGGTLLTGYGMDPAPSSGLLAYWCAEALGTAEGLDWLAAISLLADLGEKNGFAEYAAARRKYKAVALRTVATLVNTPRRVAAGDATGALELLLRSADPQALLVDPGAETLRAAKAEWDEALAAARRIGPKIRGEIALIEVNTPCQVHPVVAQTWVGRLHKNIVICANAGFLPGRINFAVRTKLPVNLLEFLARHRPPGAGEDYGRGHDQATGGSLTPADWSIFLGSLGIA